MTGTVVVIHSQADFQRSLQESKAWGGKGVVVDFYADWCGPCKMMAPMFEEMARQHPNIVFLKVNVDECQDVARVEQVSALPTFKAYFAGSVVGEVVGASPQKIAALIADVTAKMEAASAGTGRRLGGGEEQQPQAPVPAADSADEVALRRERVARAAEARLAQA